MGFTPPRTVRGGDARQAVPGPGGDSQEAILLAFQEESWPPFIDDPLPVVAEMAPKQRLRNAIRRLNDRQRTCLLHIFGNGNGEGVGWQLVMQRPEG